MIFSSIISICLAITIPLSIIAGVNEVVFIGITPGGAPSMEKSFDKQLRMQLSVQPNINAADYMITQRFSRLIHFEDFPVVSTKLVESIERFASDTTLFIWGQVYKSTVTPSRKHLFKAVLKGELDIGLTIYSLDKKEYAYSGKIHSEFTKSKGIILLGASPKLIHVNALDKTELLELCIADAVQKSIDIINAIIRSQTINGENIQSPTVEMYKVPSISDVFSVPSIEARGVGNEIIKKDSISK